MVIAGYDDQVSVFTRVFGFAGQPAAVAAALAAFWAAASVAVAVVVVTGAVVVVEEDVVVVEDEVVVDDVFGLVVVVVVSADEWDQGWLINRTEPTTMTASPPMMREFRSSFFRRTRLASAAFFRSRPA